jgi:hypothetical protein
MGRPYSENDAFFLILLGEMRAEEIIASRYVALMEKVQRKFIFFR